MSRYRRAYIKGGIFFFTVTLADRPSDLFVRHIDRLRRIYGSVQRRYPFETIAICVLPDHLHAIWSLPEGDADFSLRWNLIKGGFSRGLPGEMPLSSSKIARRERGIWQRRYWEHAIRDEADLEEPRQHEVAAVDDEAQQELDVGQYALQPLRPDGPHEPRVPDDHGQRCGAGRGGEPTLLGLRSLLGDLAFGADPRPHDDLRPVVAA